MNHITEPESQFVVYILYSESYDKIYIGFTNNLIERNKALNYLAKKGWTVKFRPWKVILTEFYPSKPEAMKRESVPKMSKLRTIIRAKISEEYDTNGFISV